MGKHHLRKDKECQNCGHIVEQRFCTHCGQENTETRQTFAHLVRHFFEDLTHYDSGFWKTIKYLLFRPAFLTKELLAGKRVRYVPPVRLYIFISFLCFFLPYILPDFSKETKTEREHQAQPIEDEVSHASNENHVFRTGVYWSSLHMEGSEFVFEQPNDFRSVAQLDSTQAAWPESKRYNWLEYRMAKRIIEIYQHYSQEEINKQFNNSFEHNLPKSLFVFMPFFALMLWLIHGKRKWMYFDHAIFTLHNFSYMLLVFSIMSVIDSIFTIWSVDGSMENIVSTIAIGMFVWILYYFFRSHRKMYGESWIVSTLKSLLLLIINIISILLLMFVFCNITLFNLH